MARVATLATEVTADIGPLKTQMKAAGRSVQDFTRRARTESRSFDAAQRAATQANRRFGSQVQNAAFQVGDFAVQVGGGTSAMRAMSQQLPQLLGGFGVMGAVAGAAFAIIGPLAESLFKSADGASEYDDALSGLSGTLGSVRGQVSTLGDLQERLNTLHRAQAGASASGASAVIANTQKEFNARKELIAVEQTLLRLRSQDAVTALNNLRAQEAEQSKRRLERLRTLGPGATGTGVSDAEGFAGGGARMNDILLGAGLTKDQIRAQEETRNQIRRLEAELQLVNIAADEAAQALDGVFGGDSDVVGGSTGGGAARTSSPAVQEVKAISEELSNLTRMTQGELSEQLGAWGEYFNNLNTVSGAGSKKLAATAKALGAIEATINAYRAATQALADPSVPFWGKAAAYATTLATGLGAVSAIKSASTSGGTSSATAAAAATSTSPRQVASISIQGSNFSADSVRDLINQINEAVEGGAVLRLA